ncbi:Sensor histidine kinase RcsC [Dyadobacter sp. CECT 9275]|uniref:histidine kinase n=1 Tax=Dyadobacter helix TaxID=2822344 RepID=A0A916N5E6_9BACT|nr:response regulator [Dyadobacter sp. CECT 9275]CAG4997962.1 Sensor histidine kinase RcsC [Dyadobacter sp. CECT 9275]
MMRLSFQKQILLGIIFSILLVITVGTTSYQALRLQQENSAVLNHTREVLNTTNEAENLILLAETNIRGFGLSRNVLFENSYRQAVDRVWINHEKLKELFSDNPKQLARLDSLENLVQVRLEQMNAQLDRIKHDTQDLTWLKANVLKGKYLSDRIAANFREIQRAEQQLLAIRERNVVDSSQTAERFIIFGNGIFLMVVFIMTYLIRNTYQAQVASERATNEANSRLEILSAEDQERNWVLNAAIEIGVALRGEPTKTELANRLLTKISETSNAMVAVMYQISQSGDYLDLAATYGVDNTADIPKVVKSGEGILGQMLADQVDMKKIDISPGYLKVRTGVGSTSPGSVFIKSFTFDDKVVALVEIAFLTDPGMRFLKPLDMAGISISAAIVAARARQITMELLEKTQLQAEELSSQQEEMRVINEELTNQTSMLQVSEEELRVQQEELKQINTELEEKAFMLEEQKNMIEEARDQIQLKADELERAGKFKSEFLANMSHELRTPLNSILILSRILEENKGTRLSSEEQHYASVIYNSGNDLLTLINDILDLAKVEAGKVELNFEQVRTESLLTDMRNLFQKVADNKGISLVLDKSDDCPDSLWIDPVRVLQVVRNLLSNAIKFTSAPGTVSFKIRKCSDSIQFEISDTGIGIPIDKQNTVFEAFQQADGSTSRKYGGTGLGLSISRELSILMGGNIGLKSEPGVGSVFTLTIPYLANPGEVVTEPVKNPSPDVIESSAYTGLEGHRLLLIEDDAVFANDMAAKARKSGFEVVIASTGEEALRLVKTFKPTAITLDMHLPDISGKEILNHIKNDPFTRQIPVHIVSAGDNEQALDLKDSIIGFMQKPVDRESAEKIFDLLKLKGKDLSRQRILLIEDDTFQSKYLGEFLVANGIFVLYAYTGKEAMDILNNNIVDGIILDIHLTDMNGLELLDVIKANPELSKIPVVINTAEDLSQADLARIMKYAHPIVMKTRKSNERLLDEVKLFLRNIQPEPLPSLATHSGSFSNPVVNADRAFVGKKILVADDDMRNIFALSAILEESGFSLVIATNGVEALAKLEENEGIELVLMDVMMPEMDGIEATRRIRQHSKWARLPIIAVTAKAMHGDREQCIAAGASDYISKPIDIDKLLSLIKVWLHSA